VRGEFDDELRVKDVTWLSPAGGEMQPEHSPEKRWMDILSPASAQADRGV
jgi:hypothetical protein